MNPKTSLEPEPTISDAAKAAANAERSDRDFRHELGFHVQAYADQSTAQLQQRVAELERELVQSKFNFDAAVQMAKNAESERDALKASRSETRVLTRSL